MANAFNRFGDFIFHQAVGNAMDAGIPGQCRGLMLRHRYWRYYPKILLYLNICKGLHDSSRIFVNMCFFIDKTAIGKDNLNCEPY